MTTVKKPSLDSLFQVEEKRTEEASFDDMSDFSEHCFDLYTGQRLQNLVDSIKRNGILEPLLLWNRDGEYVLLSGYNRRNAGRLAGLEKGPVRIFKNLSKEDAVFIMTETNLYQRSFSDMNPMEKARCLSEHHKCLKCQGKRNDLLKEIPNIGVSSATSSDCQTRLRSDQIAGEAYYLTRDKASKYIRIGSTALSPTLQELFKQKKVPLTQMYHLSYLDIELQKAAARIFAETKQKIGPTLTKKVKEVYQEGKLDEDTLRGILCAEPLRGRPSLAIDSGILSRYFCRGEDAQTINRTIENALAAYFKTEIPP